MNETMSYGITVVATVVTVLSIAYGFGVTL